MRFLQCKRCGLIDKLTDSGLCEKCTEEIEEIRLKKQLKERRKNERK